MVKLKSKFKSCDHVFEFSYHLIDGERSLSTIVGIVHFSANKPWDFHNVTFSVSPKHFEV